MKKTLSIILAAFAMLACGNPQGGTTLQAKEPTPAPNLSYKISGTIDHSTWTPGQESTVTFTGMPKTVAQFQDAIAAIGSEPQGAVLLCLIAMEMYRRDNSVGAECVKLIQTDSNLPSIMRRLPEIFRKNDTYARPYLVSAFMMGANPRNGYNPEYPYKIRVRVNPANGYEKSMSLKGYVLHLQVYSDGYDTHWRGVDVVKQVGCDYYKVQGCASCYTQCQELDWEYPAEWIPLK